MTDVLLVDDDPISRRVASIALRTEGLEVTEAADAIGAAIALATHHPRVVLLDIDMPDFDGFTLASRLRDWEVLDGVRLIALTAYALPEFEERAREVGFEAFITKPIDTRTIASRVRELLESPPAPPAAIGSQRSSRSERRAARRDSPPGPVFAVALPLA